MVLQTTGQRLAALLAIHAVVIFVLQLVQHELNAELLDGIFFGVVSGQVALLAMWTAVGPGYWLVRRIHTGLLLVGLWCVCLIQFWRGGASYALMAAVLAAQGLLFALTTEAAWWTVRQLWRRRLDFGDAWKIKPRYSLRQLLLLVGCVGLALAAVRVLWPHKLGILGESIKMPWFDISAYAIQFSLFLPLISIPLTLALLNQQASKRKRIAVVGASLMAAAAGLSIDPLVFPKLSWSQTEWWSAAIWCTSVVGTVVATVAALRVAGMRWERRES